MLLWNTNFKPVDELSGLFISFANSVRCSSTLICDEHGEV